LEQAVPEHHVCYHSSDERGKRNAEVHEQRYKRIAAELD
jgi:hypothetical protein